MRHKGEKHKMTNRIRKSFQDYSESFKFDVTGNRISAG